MGIDAVCLGLIITFASVSKPKAIVSVINDLVTDQRVHKTCTLLHENGYEVLLVGRVLPASLPMPLRLYATHRMKLWFSKGVAFYTEFTIRLFLFLLKNKAQLLVANDLDTLLPNYFFSKKRAVPLVYDSHEIFCEVPELQHTPFKKYLWQQVEKKIIPKLKYRITVNESIARWFFKKYQVPFSVVRNVPDTRLLERVKTREELNLPVRKKIILLQGSGINMHRGAEETVEAMQYIENAVLLIIGGGDAWPALKERIEKLNLHEKVCLMNKMSPQELYSYTCNADVGLSLDKDTNMNYRYSLPNKIFDYVQASVPILASPLPEVKAFIEKYSVGMCIENHQPKHIADSLRTLLASPHYTAWKANTQRASQENNWELEKKTWLQLLDEVRREQK
ncbi:MAG: glycosyltransferase [Bacteroidetes bacterium]|nr:glycosyltransferase [Bacteroidota bacterium]